MVKKRCPYCHKHTRPDGTCQTEGCPLYVPKVTEEKPQEQTDGNDEN